MKYPIGIDHFGELIDSGAAWVDKSLLIKEIIDDGSKIILIPRPRRFGKTLNLSMLQHFFSEKVDGQPTADLFKSLKINQVEGDYLKKYQGKYPVILVTLKGIKTSTYKEAIEKLKLLVQELYMEHKALLTSKAIEPEEKKIIKSYLSGKITQPQLELSLKRLTQYLKKHYKKNAILLIDEYDAPLQAAHLNDGEDKDKDEGYRNQMTSLMRGMLGEALKGNSALYKGVMTGILRIAKENIFSDLNNLSVYTIFDEDYATAFGFTEKEVKALIHQSGLSVNPDDIQDWYNGYNFAENTIYNPWSIINCLSKRAILRPYWVNTSSNELIRKTVRQAPLRNKWLIEKLIRNEAIQCEIKDHLTFDDLAQVDVGMWSLLLMSGYLTYANCRLNKNRYACDLKIPNREVLGFFEDTLCDWLLGDRSAISGDHFLQNLLDGNFERAERQFNELLLRVISHHDVTERTQEAFYQGLMIGCLLLLDPERYIYDSNRESGFGRYDLAIYPKDPSKDAGAIFELKALSKSEPQEGALEDLAQKALEQIDRLKYTEELKKRNVSTVRKIGFAFCGKTMKIAYPPIIPTDEEV